MESHFGCQIRIFFSFNLHTGLFRICSNDPIFPQKNKKVRKSQIAKSTVILRDLKKQTFLFFLSHHLSHDPSDLCCVLVLLTVYKRVLPSSPAFTTVTSAWCFCINIQIMYSIIKYNSQWPNYIIFQPLRNVAFSEIIYHFKMAYDDSSRVCPALSHPS